MKTLVKILFALLIAVAVVNTAGAQSQKAIKEAKKAAEIKSLIDSKNYIFQASYMYPSSGGSRYLTSPYDLTVSPDTVEAYLPYFGVSYSGAGYNSSDDNGIKFKSTRFDYATKTKNDGSYTINIKANDTRNATQMILQVYTNGNADLTVVSMNRQQIRFNGYIKERSKPKV